MRAKRSLHQERKCLPKLTRCFLFICFESVSFKLNRSITTGLKRLGTTSGPFAWLKRLLKVESPNTSILVLLKLSWQRVVFSQNNSGFAPFPNCLFMPPGEFEPW